MYSKYIHDETSLYLIEEILKNSRIDVSYMSDEEFKNCLDGIFNSLNYHSIDKKLLNGTKYMDKHLNIGDQVSQISGVSYPIPIDNYIKIVKGVKFYARYMDDSYIIHNDKQFLKDLLEDIIIKCKELGININLKKTRIVKLSSSWKFLQIKYSLTETGRVIQRINPKSITRMRRKMKKVVTKVDEVYFENWFYSWFKNYYKLMSKYQRSNIENLYCELKEKTYGKVTVS